jgi:hypothetical protein
VLAAAVSTKAPSGQLRRAISGKQLIAASTTPRASMLRLES